MYNYARKLTTLPQIGASIMRTVTTPFHIQHKKTRKNQSSLKLLALLITAMGVLQGCGGGGGDDTLQLPSSPAPATPSTPAPSTTSSLSDTSGTSDTPTTPETPATPDTPSTPATPSDPYGPVTGSEPAPLLSNPQPGSTADVGSAWEGIYESTFGYTFITPDGTLSRTDSIYWTWGSISVTDAVNWTFNSDTFAWFITASSVTGSGTFTPKTSMDGTYAVGTKTPAAWGPLTYSRSNALAVTLADLQGTWSTSGTYAMSLQFDTNGTFSGTTSGSQLGICQLSGNLVQATPDSAKNMFRLTMNAVNAASGSAINCKLNRLSPYQGLGAIVLTPAGRYEQNGYIRNIVFNARTNDNASFFSIILSKEQP